MQPPTYVGAHEAKRSVKMKLFILCIFGSFFITSCSNAPTSPLVGTWLSSQKVARGEVQRIITFESAGGYTEKGLIKAFFSGKSLNYQASGKWTLDSKSLSMTPTHSSSPIASEVGKEYIVEITFLDSDTMNIEYLNGDSFIARRNTN